MSLRLSLIPLLAGVLVFSSFNSATAQQTSPESASVENNMHDELRRLAAAVSDAQAQVEASQKHLAELQTEILRLQVRTQAFAEPDATGADISTSRPPEDSGVLAGQVAILRERQEVQQAEIATHEQAKVETESKYPVKVTGLILMNAFTNTRGVDSIQVPSLATDGSGSTGATFRQTILGIDGRGPYIFGATTHADLRVDFFGASTQSNYGSSAGLLRLRTAHAVLDWDRIKAFVQLDHPVFSPNTPTSLTTIAEPALAWSGNLWTWLPQAGVTHRFWLGQRSQVKLQAGLMDVPDPPLTGTTSTSTASFAEQSRWPGTEARIVFGSRDEEKGTEIGFGGYFSTHHLGGASGFNAWAGTADYHIPLPAHLELTGSFYRGLALGGLGGGAYKDYVYKIVGNTYLYRALDDVGGWTQIKAGFGERLQLNAALGLDNAFAGQIRPYTTTVSSTYANLARNQTVFTNAIYSPNSSAMFSLEFRHIASSPAIGRRYDANVIGVAAGYKF